MSKRIYDTKGKVIAYEHEDAWIIREQVGDVNKKPTKADDGASINLWGVALGALIFMILVVIAIFLISLLPAPQWKY